MMMVQQPCTPRTVLSWTETWWQSLPVTLTLVQHLHLTEHPAPAVSWTLLDDLREQTLMLRQEPSREKGDPAGQSY